MSTNISTVSAIMTLIPSEDWNKTRRENEELREENKLLHRRIDKLVNEDLKLRDNDIKCLKEENAKLRLENEELRKKVLHLEIIQNKQAKIIEDLQRKELDREYRNYFCDIFRYFRDNFLTGKMNEFKDEFTEEFLTLESDKLLTKLYKQDKYTNQVKIFLKKLSLDPDIILDLMEINSDRNDNSHHIKLKDYSVPHRMKDALNKFKKATNNLNENSSLYTYQSDILDFVDKILANI
jgi:hypothetical protein